MQPIGQFCGVILTIGRRRPVCGIVSLHNFTVHALQVVLFQSSAATCIALPSQEQCLQPGMQVTAYYADDHDSEALHRRVEAAVHDLTQDSSAVLVQFASHCSTVIYITVVRASAEVSVKQLVTALKRNSITEAAPKVFVQHGDDCFFELREEGVPSHCHSCCSSC